MNYLDDARERHNALTLKQDLSDGGYVSDADRDRYLPHMRDMFAAGYLTLEQFHERTDAVLAARTRLELRKTTEHLPPLPVTVAAKTAGRPFPRPNWRVWCGTGFVVSLLALVVIPMHIATAYHGLGHADSLAGLVASTVFVLGSLGAVVSLVSGIISWDRS
jgi:Domain of unknown function (DUF1707)